MPRNSLLKSPWGREEFLTGARMRRTPQPATPAVWEAYRAANTGLMWHVIPGTGPMELKAIVAALEHLKDQAAKERSYVPGRWKKNRPEPSALGRNCALFDIVRFYAYDHAERDGGAILAKAIAENARFPIPLPASEVAATARSIARYMGSRFNPKAGPGRIRRGRDTDTAKHALPVRRGIAGERSGAARAAVTDGRIRDALARLAAAGIIPTQGQLAAEAGVSVRTVRSRWHLPVVRQIGVLSGGAEGSEAGGGLQAGQKESKQAQGKPASVLESSSPQVANAAPRRSPAPVRGPLAFLGMTDPILARLAQPGPTLAEHLHQTRLARPVLAALQAVVVATKKRGAAPPALPELHPGVLHLPEVVRAMQAAKVAIADATRRVVGRERALVAAARRAELRQAYADPARGLRWWKAQMAELSAAWDGREHEAELMGASSRDLEYLKVRRTRAFACCWRQWRAAAREVVAAGPQMPLAW